MKIKKICSAIFVIFQLVACTSSQQPAENSTNLRFSVVQNDQIFESIGMPYPIEVDNCEGARDSEKVEQRSRTYITELHLDVTKTVAVEVGGDIKVAKAILSEQIGATLGTRIGTSAEAVSSVKIVTPAGYKSITYLQWKEVWTSGSISILRSDGTYVDVLPFSVLNALTLEQLKAQTIDCNTGSVAENSSPAQISTPEIPIIRPTSVPVLIGTISVPGNLSDGTKFISTHAGVYSFKYLRGSYSPHSHYQEPPSGVLTWLTAVRVFKNRPIVWNEESMTGETDYRIADFGYFATDIEAEATAENALPLTIPLLAGDYLILVAVDNLSDYFDNPGEVILEVFYTPPQ
jgi:hypothetical protein